MVKKKRIRTKRDIIFENTTFIFLCIIMSLFFSWIGIIVGVILSVGFNFLLKNRIKLETKRNIVSYSLGFGMVWLVLFGYGFYQGYTSVEFVDSDVDAMCAQFCTSIENAFSYELGIEEDIYYCDCLDNEGNVLEHGVMS